MSTVAPPRYLSADSAPQGLAARRPVWLAPAVLGAYALGCAATVPALPGLTRRYAEVVAAAGGVPVDSVAAPGASISFRPFLVLLLVLLAACSPGAARARAALAAWTVSAYALVVVALDTALAAAHRSFLPPPLAAGPGIVTAVAGVVVVVVSIFTHRRLPPGVRIPTRRPAARTSVPILLGAVGGAAVVTVAWRAGRLAILGPVHVPFNGWLTHDLAVAVIALVCVLRALSALEERQLPTRGPRLSVAFLVPAHNEAHGIGACIRSLDAAAARHPGRCAAWIVDNASSDGTGDVARAALAACSHLEGGVLSCPTPGKARALNFGLSRITEDLVVRIDADTEVEPSLLAMVVPRFWDRSVGGVGGFPLPKEGGPRWLHALRLVEMYTAIAFFRVASSAIDGTTVMPGSIAAYRRCLLSELGGFGSGFNGEDSDVTMRIGRLGYRVVTDARVRVRTECPGTLAELREQRQRWTRGRFHMAARNLSAIRMAQGVRATWMLPQSLVNAGRRCLLIPLLAGALTVHAVDPSVLSLSEVFGVARVVVGVQVVVAVVLLAVHRQYRALPYAPLVLVYRLVLAYFAFETVLTLAVRDTTRAKARVGTVAGRPCQLIPTGGANT